jgi:hypothetical protein
MGQGFVTITVNDNGTSTITVPAPQTQVVIGCASGGTTPVNVPYATTSPATLVANSGYGDLCEAAALSIAKGAVVIAILATIATAGTATDPILTGTGTSVVTTTLASPQGAFSTFYVQMNVLNGGAIGTGPITAQFSLDAGRNFGPPVSLGTATTYTIPNTGVTLDFASGTLVTGDVVKFSTVGPKPNTSGIQAALTALKASSYTSGGWGSMHIVGAFDGADIQTINGYIDTAAAPAFFTNNIYTRFIGEARDASPPVAWGGSGETETAWITSILNDFSSTIAKRACVGAGYYNMPSAMGAGLGMGGVIVGAPSYRRPGAWAAAARRIQTPPQRLLSRVRDGALDNIVVNPTTDPTDGFVYHDERINPGLDFIIAGTGGRFMAFMTRQGLPGFYVSDPLLMSDLGSDFRLLPDGDVMDIFCGLIQTTGTQEIDEDVRLTLAGTLNPNDAINIQNAIANVCNANMTNVGMCSALVITVDQLANVLQTSNVPITGTLYRNGYVLSITVNVAYG